MNNRNSNKFPKLSAALTITVRFFILIIVISACSFPGRPNPLPGGSLRVEVVSPPNGYQTQVNAPNPVNALASHTGGVTRLELYADGVLVASRISMESGSSFLSLVADWTPSTPGLHVLVARGYSPDNQFADSRIIFVDVSEETQTALLYISALPRPQGAKTPSLNDIAAGAYTTLQELKDLNPALDAIDPAAPLAPGLQIAVPRPTRMPDADGSPPSPQAALQPAPQPGTPGAPTGLALKVDCNSATLTWQDSPDEKSYVVYRLFPGQFKPQVISALKANTISFREKITAPGVFLYQVAAVSGRLEGLSPVVTAAIPKNCPPPAVPDGMTGDLVLKLSMLETGAAWDGAYCYFSFNGGSFLRFPQGDFTTLSPYSGSPTLYQLHNLPEGGRFDLAGQPESSPLVLRAECMGREGTSAHSLGIIEASHPRSDWDGSPRTAAAEGYTLSYCLGPASTPCLPPGAGGPGDEEVGDTYIIFGLFPDMMLNLPPPVHVRLTNNNDFAPCSGLDIWQAAACTRERLGQGKILDWDWTGNGVYQESSLTGYQVHAAIGDAYNIREVDWNVTRRPDGTLPRFAPSRLEELGCGVSVQYLVRAVAGARTSAYSSIINLTTPACTNNATPVEIIFDELNFISPHSPLLVDPGDFCTMGMPNCPRAKNYLEILLKFSTIVGDAWTEIDLVGSPSSGEHYRVVSQTEIPLSYFTVMTGRHYSLIDLLFGRRTTGYTASEGYRAANRIRTQVNTPDRELTIRLDLYDLDILPSVRRDQECTAQQTIRVNNYAEWATLMRSFTLRGNGCEVSGRVIGGIVPDD